MKKHDRWRLLQKASRLTLHFNARLCWWCGDDDGRLCWKQRTCKLLKKNAKKYKTSDKGRRKYVQYRRT